MPAPGGRGNSERVTTCTQKHTSRLRTRPADSAASWWVQDPCRGRPSPVPGRLTRRSGPPVPAPA